MIGHQRSTYQVLNNQLQRKNLSPQDLEVRNLQNISLLFLNIKMRIQINSLKITKEVYHLVKILTNNILIQRKRLIRLSRQYTMLLTHLRILSMEVIIIIIEAESLKKKLLLKLQLSKEELLEALKQVPINLMWHIKTLQKLQICNSAGKNKNLLMSR